MEESRKPRYLSPRAWCLLIVMVLKGIIICSTFTAYYLEQRRPVTTLQSQKWLNQDTQFSTILISRTSGLVKEQPQEGGRRLLGELETTPTNCKLNSNCEGTFSNLNHESSSFRGNGIKATLTHDFTSCSHSSSSAGTSSSVTAIRKSNHSREVKERLEYLNCALQRSSSRVGYLLSRKVPASNHQTMPSAVHANQLATLDESLHLPTSEFKNLEDAVVREVQKSPEWSESYESDVWSEPGEYMMNIGIGTPPRRLTGIVDTASDLPWFQCQRCRHCYQQVDPIFDPSNSSTYVEVKCASKTCLNVHRARCDAVTNGCDYFLTYGDNSYTFGTLSTDTFTIQSSNTSKPSSIPDVKFGCSRTSRGTFTHTRADGIVALGGGPLSLATQLGQHISDKFAYCLVSRWHSSSVTSPIYFGDAAILDGSDVQYTSILENQRYRPYYYVKMEGISVGGHRLKIPHEVFDIDHVDGRGGTIVDSGTTFTNLRSEAYDILIDAMNSSTHYPTTTSFAHFDLCFDVYGNRESGGAGVEDSDDLIEVVFPKLVFHLAGVDLDLPLENYILQVEPFVFCLLIDRSAERLTAIGNVQQQNFQVLYDRENSRMGFRRHDCHKDGNED